MGKTDNKEEKIFRASNKVKITIVEDDPDERNRKYKLIHDEMYKQYLALNMCMSLLATQNTLRMYNSGAENRLLSQIAKLDKKISEKQQIADKDANTEKEQTRKQKAIEDITKLEEEKSKLREEFDKKAANRTDIDVKFHEQYTSDLYQIIRNEFDFASSATTASVVRKVKDDFKNSFSMGYAKGERSLISYKRSFPLMIRGNEDACYDNNKRKWLDFYYDGDDILIRWLDGIIFKAILGNNPNRNMEIKHTLHKIITGEYRVSQSSIEFDDKGHMYMNVNYRFKKNSKTEIIPGRTLGVDLGIATPAYVCLSDTTYVRSGIGSANDFFRIRQQMKSRRRSLYKSLSLVKGGKGRKKKLQAINSLRDKERNFAKTYNHQLSNKIVKFAKDNGCEFINLEHLTKNGFEDAILSSWSYYELQNMIEYKAEREGIKVRYVDPAYTSQTCSKCGHVDKENRPTQAKFKCINCGLELNADHNASINIARSDNFVNNKKK